MEGKSFPVQVPSLREPLPLRCFAPTTAHASGTTPAVLLLHGASASSETFLLPREHGLMHALCQRGFEVWLLDWRGGKLVADVERAPERRALFTMDRVADEDIPAALRVVHARRADKAAKLHVAAHCFGAGCLAMAIGGGALEKLAREEHIVIDKIVLLTLGLFYVAPWDGFIKADDFVIERVIASAPEVHGINPHVEQQPWPAQMERAFEKWPKQLLPQCGIASCQRVSFMFGAPYLEANLPDDIHCAETIAAQFGTMPIMLYAHAGQNVRRGYAAPLDAEPTSAGKAERRRYVQRAPFEAHDVTLITGTENTIWHPDSIHRMHEWLMASPGRRSVKHVVPGYGHQDLLWGRRAEEEIYPMIVRGLGG
jgi:pimeloyl-ACP methyl ester carboxylesterase